MREIYCHKYAKTLPGLSAPPFPGPRGQMIYEKVSAQAWAEWQVEQIKIINEQHLNLRLATDRDKLYDAMDNFLFN